MSTPREVLDVVRQWIDKANNDLRTAEYTLRMPEECPFDTVCFHAQQCIEKYLKALLCLHGIAFPKTHDLTELCALLPAAMGLQEFSADLAEVSPYAVETRYPGAWEPFERVDAARAVQVALAFRAAALPLFPQAVLRTPRKPVESA